MAQAKTPPLIKRHVKDVDRTRTPQRMLDVLGRVQWANRDVVDTVPRGKDQAGNIYFWPVGRNISDADFEREYQADGWVAADPYLVAAMNQEDSEFADEHPNFAHWKDAQGRWCYLACGRLGDVRYVAVHHRAGGLYGDGCVAVVRKL